MKSPTQRRAIIVSTTVLILLITALTLFTPSYQTNDDVAMRLIAEGNFVPGDDPLPFLMFINVIIGKLLVLAYGITTAVPWYDLVLGGSMVAASLALVHIWAGTARRFELVWGCLFAAYFLLPTFVNVQFSLAGLACAAAGIGLIARTFAVELVAESQRRHLLAGVALFFWGSLIRLPGAALIAGEAVVLTLPLFVGAFIVKDERPRMRRALLAACLAVLLAGAGFGVNQLSYRQAKGWKDFHAYNVLRLRLAEYVTPDRFTPEATDQVTKKVGWSSNDFALFRNWFFTDPELFSLPRVREAARLFFAASNPPTEDWKKARTERGLELGKAFFLETRWAFLIMGAFVIANGVRPKLALYFAGSVAALGLFIVGLSLAFKAPPQRIFWPMLIMAVTLLAVAAQRWGRPAHWTVNVVALLLAAYTLALALPPLRQESERRRLAAITAQADVESLRRTGASMFVLHAQSFPYEDFWTPLHTENVPFDFVGLGVSARTPPVQDYLAKTQRADLPWSLCTEPGMVIIAAPYVPPMLTTFLAEHRHMKVEFREAFQGKNFQAWKCHRL